ncbi:MAG TPA: amidohydrolase family protein [Gammaproteobacteria bacterium]|jgi:aminocarboxymuconate-semialdehyde decarboxylase
MAVIDVHTHMLTRDYLDLLETHGAPDYTRSLNPAGQETILRKGAPFFTLSEPMWDYEMRIRDMDLAGVDLAIVSLTCPNAYFGDAETSLRAARNVNDSMSEQQTARPDRIRWLASLPWQYPELALQELERSTAAGAVGVMVIANIAERQLTDADFEPIWREIDRRGLPVLVHPGPPVGAADLGLADYGLVPAAGFPFDTTIAFARLFLDGFLDRYPNLKLIASHGGGALPYLAARLDRCHEQLPAASSVTQTKPSEYLRHIYYDAVVYSQSALELCLEASGSDSRVLYGSDYPHNIGDMAGCLARVDALAPTLATRVRGTNAEQLFNL